MSKTERKQPPTLKTAFTQIQSLNDRHDGLVKEVRSLKDLLNTQDNWHSETRRWLGKDVKVSFQGTETTGRFKWADRYNICVIVGSTPKIFPKGSIALEPVGDVDASA